MEVDTYLGAPPPGVGEGAAALGREDVEVATYFGMDPEAVETLFSPGVFPAGVPCGFSGAPASVEGGGTTVFGFRLIRGMETVPVPPFGAEAAPVSGVAGSGRWIFATGAVAVLINCGAEALAPSVLPVLGAGEGADIFIKGTATDMEEGSGSVDPPTSCGESGLSLIVFLAAEEAEEVALTDGILFNAEVSVLRSFRVSVTLEVFSLVSIWLICSFLFRG